MKRLGLHVLDDLLTKLATLQESGVIHEALKVIRDTFAGDRSFQTFVDQTSFTEVI